MTRPVPLGDIRDHLMLLRTMAAETGIDVAEAVVDGRLTRGEWAGAVTRCRACDWTGPCAAWLTDRQEDRPRDVPPDCGNAALLRRLIGDDAS